MDRTPYPYLQDMIDDGTPAEWAGQTPRGPIPRPCRSARRTLRRRVPFGGLRVLELTDEKGQWLGKLMGDFGADVIKIEPPGGECTRTVGPFYEDMPNRERSLYFWHYNTSKRGITLDLETEDGRQLFRKLAEGADVILETFKPGYLPSLGLGYDDLKESNPAPDHVLPDLLWSDRAVEGLPREAICCTLRRGGQMAGCGYEEIDVPDAPPIAGGGGQAWHMGSHFAYIGTVAALIYRTISRAAAST